MSDNCCTILSGCLELNVTDTWENNDMTKFEPANRDLDKNIADILILMFTVIPYPLVGVFGVLTNIINIIVFIKHGLNETVNVTLVALSVADTCSLLSLICLGVYYNPLFINSDILLYPQEASYLLAGMPRLCFSRIISLIIAFVTLERCLCVRFPLKVKTILTPRRALIVLVCIFITMIGSLIPIYFSTRLGWKMYSERQNRTLIGLIYTRDRRQIDQWTFALGTFFGLCSFITVVICTVVLISSLKRNQRWRQNSTQTSITLGRRDTRVGKMVVVISLIFIFSFIPLNAVQICMSTIPRYNKGTDIPNIYHVTWSIGYLIEAINSSVNIFVYFKMSSKYKTTLMNIIIKRLHCFCRKC